MRGLGQSKHSPAEIASLHLVLAFAQPGHEGVGEPALLVAVRFQPIHRNGILGKMGHLAEQACRHPPVLPRVALHCLLWGEGPPGQHDRDRPELFLHARGSDAALSSQAHLALEFSQRPASS
ncbi:MAG: hypothetical protein FRX49_06377 [Trebouxia sp. A1-2]|nr:MAG: hypothetical protein FRX49_06377 [Trebouxia sp. A1-2]